MQAISTTTLTPSLLRKIDAYWRAANYLSVGQIYLYDNPLLKQPLKLEHVKPLVVGHWGTTPGQNFIYVRKRCRNDSLAPERPLEREFRVALEFLERLRHAQRVCSVR